MDAVPPPAANDEAVALELVERPCDGLPRRSGHFAEQLVCEGKVEPDRLGAHTTMCAGKLDERLTDAVDMVKPREVRDCGVLLPQRLGKTVEQSGGCIP